jgi:diguanylate cyclase (GGDEF)-like protein
MKLDNKNFIIFGALISFPFIGILDHYSGYEISFSIFYLIPIIIITYNSGNIFWPYFSCFIGAMFWLTADISSGHSYANIFIPFWNMIVRFGIFSVIAFHIIKQKKLLQLSEDLSRTDSLTNIGNSRYFYEICENEVHRSTRYSRTLTLIYLDIDNFKPVNDSLGHLKGNELLKLVAEIISNTIRKTDYAARLGGDEFVILLPEINVDQAQMALNRLSKALSESAKTNNFPVTFSFGMATFLNPPGSVDELINTADSLMYKSKKSGKNQIHTGVFNDVSLNAGT